jgi:hypothetical protein
MRILFMILLSLFSQSPSLPQDEPALDSVVRFGVFCNNQFNPLSTGFFASDSEVITAGHAYWDAGKQININRCGIMALAWDDTVITPLTITTTDDLHDLAIGNVKSIQRPIRQPAPLRIFSTTSKHGEEIHAIGYFGADAYPTLTKGTVAGFVPSSRDILLDLTINPGQSGAPVFLSGTKSVVGMIVGQVPTPQQIPSGIAKATSAEHIINLMKQVRADR